MKIVLPLVGAVSLTLGLLGGELLGAPHVVAPLTMSGPALVSPATEIAPMSTPSLHASVVAEPPLRISVEDAAALPPSHAHSSQATEGRPVVSAANEACREAETLSLRLPLEREEAVRAWLPFRKFVEQQGVDTHSLGDESIKSLFERFMRLNEQRIAELSTLAIVPEYDDAGSAMLEIDTAPLEAVEARYTAMEASLAIEFRGVE